MFTVLPHFVLRYRQMPPEVAYNVATHGSLSLELCAVLYHLSPMALSRISGAPSMQVNVAWRWKADESPQPTGSSIWGSSSKR